MNIEYFRNLKISPYNILLGCLYSVAIIAGIALPGITNINKRTPASDNSLAIEISSDNVLSTALIDATATPAITVTTFAEPMITTITTTIPVTTVKTTTKAPTATAKPTNKPTAVPTTTVTVTTLVPTTITIDYSHSRQVAPNCPASTQACVPCTSGASCRFELNGYAGHGFLGWACQNNNPGNIRPASFKNTLIANNGGTPPCGQRTDAAGRGDYMVFSSYSAGFGALKAYLKGIVNGQHSAYKGCYDYTPNDGVSNCAGNPITETCGNCSLKFFASKYSGTTLQDDPNSYANKLANQLGVSADTPILGWIVSNKLDQLATAIQTNEGWFTQ